MKIGDFVICIDNSPLLSLKEHKIERQNIIDPYGLFGSVEGKEELTIGKYYEVLALSGDKEVDKDSTHIWIISNFGNLCKLESSRFGDLKDYRRLKLKKINSR